MGVFPNQTTVDQYRSPPRKYSVKRLGSHGTGKLSVSSGSGRSVSGRRTFRIIVVEDEIHRPRFEDLDAVVTPVV